MRHLNLKICPILMGAKGPCKNRWHVRFSVPIIFYLFQNIEPYSTTVHLSVETYCEALATIFWRRLRLQEIWYFTKKRSSEWIWIISHLESSTTPATWGSSSWVVISAKASLSSSSLIGSFLTFLPLDVDRLLSPNGYSSLSIIFSLKIRESQL